MLFKDFVGYLSQLENTASRNQMTVLLSDMFGKLDKSNIDKALYLLMGRVSPKFVAEEFNFSVKMIIRTIESTSSNFTFGYEQKHSVEEIFKKHGDIGKTVEIYWQEKGIMSNNLDLGYVYDKLLEIVKTTGNGSQQLKTEKVRELIDSMDKDEAKFLARIIVGKLRLGISEKTILDALSWFKSQDKSLRDDFERAFGVCTDIGKLGKVTIDADLKDIRSILEQLTITPGVPIASKLVERETSARGVFARMQNIYAQPKLDGLRIQIHKWVENNNVHVELFSRNLENMTESFPEIVSAMSNFPEQSIILDSEVIGVDLQTGKYLAFQDTIQRKRKHEVAITMESIPVKAEVFDVLYLEGRDISREPIEYRMSVLENSFKQVSTPSISKLNTQHIETESELQEFYTKCVNTGLEGIIAKSNGTKYLPGTRNFDWIKLKASAREDMVDSVDAVVLGYYVGEGKRNKFGIGAFLIGVYDKDRDEYETIAKVGTGITDEQFGQIKSDLDKLIITRPLNYNIHKSLIPDFYVKPEIVVVVEADQITRSSMHTASIDKEGRGLSLRFPRLIEWNRKDKGIADADTTESLTKMFNLKN